MRRSPVAVSHRLDPIATYRSVTHTRPTARHRDMRPAGPRLVPRPISWPLPGTVRNPDETREFAQSIIERLSQRKLVQWTAAYLAAAWLLLQLTDVLSEIWTWPLTLQRAASLVLGMGLFPAIVIAWFHGEKGRQDVCPLEVVIIGTLVASSSAVIWYFCGGPIG